MKSFSYTELDRLAGEVLPERAVLSTLLVGGGDDDNDNDNDNHNFNLDHGNGHGNGEGHTVTNSACSGNSNQPQMGLLSLWQTSPAANSQICSPTQTALNG
ncbi:hypothetical protein E1264_18000 [Actinomadura sp. KC216]|uniref:hypothetical protein n=1 Tax=Actinomadura sp. KC216 TaxID=2530370 RepID=UPI00104FC8B8|nr:hypothetical protein [Actinomadura sp. KC216]TDB86397.1 hypothetical protein E1264_18000 [Actinomadura sp. KC216]